MGKRVEILRGGAEGGGDGCIQNYTGKDSMRGSKKDLVQGDDRFTDMIGSWWCLVPNSSHPKSANRER